MLPSVSSAIFQLVLLSSSTLAFPPFFHGREHGLDRHRDARAINFQTNDAKNSLVVIPINPRDGTLSGGIKVATGDSGSNIAVNGSSTPATPDALGSQGSVTVAGKYTFVVNAGSRTLSMFETSRFGASGPHLLGTPGKLPGDFPNTVAVSFRRRLACVGFSGAQSGVSCVPFGPRGLGKAGPLYPLPLGQSTPPNSLLNLLGQVFFSDDEEHVYVTVRGKTGFFASIPVSSLVGQGDFSAGIMSLKDPKLTLFDGVAILRSNNVLVSDPTVGARLLAIDSATQVATVERTVNVTRQKATCWITADKETGNAYIDDAGQRKLIELDARTGAIKHELAYGGSASGGFDLAAAGGYIYILYAGNGTIPGSVTVARSEGRKGGLEMVQEFSLAQLGISPNAMGMALSY